MKKLSELHTRNIIKEITKDKIKNIGKIAHMCQVTTKNTSYKEKYKYINKDKI